MIRENLIILCNTHNEAKEVVEFVIKENDVKAPGNFFLYGQYVNVRVSTKEGVTLGSYGATDNNYPTVGDSHQRITYKEFKSKYMSKIEDININIEGLSKDKILEILQFLQDKFPDLRWGSGKSLLSFVPKYSRIYTCNRKLYQDVSYYNSLSFEEYKRKFFGEDISNYIPSVGDRVKLVSNKYTRINGGWSPGMDRYLNGFYTILTYCVDTKRVYFKDVYGLVFDIRDIIPVDIKNAPLEKTEDDRPLTPSESIETLIKPIKGIRSSWRDI